MVLRDEELLKDLTQLWGVSGYEGRVRAFIRQRVEGYADEVLEDAIGNLIVLKKGNGSPTGKKIMFAAHMDEIGFMVKKIEDNGTLRLCNMGWNWVPSAYNQRLVFENGICGVVGCEGWVEDAKNDVGKLFLDIGAKDRSDALTMVNIGSPCGYEGAYRPMAHGKMISKTFDDRAGCYQMIQALKQNDGSGPNDVYYVFTVQEELGCRGSHVAAARILPDIGIAVDVTPAHDVPCDLVGENKVGGGIGIKICDPSVVCDQMVVEAMVQCCKDGNIPYQLEVIDKGGTDASSMNLSGFGCKTGGISLVDRYPHSPSSVISGEDLEAGVDLMVAFVKLSF